MAYTTNTAVKTYLDISGSGDDALLTTLITYAQKVIETATGRIFEASTNTIRYFVVGEHTEGRTLWLDRDLASINTITNGDDVLVTSGQYRTKPISDTPFYAIVLTVTSGVVWQYTSDPEEDFIEVSGKWAYSTTAPNDIVQATTRLTAWLYRQRGQNTDLDRAMLADGVWIMPHDLPRDVSAMIMPYVKRL